MREDITGEENSSVWLHGVFVKSCYSAIVANILHANAFPTLQQRMVFHIFYYLPSFLYEKFSLEDVLRTGGSGKVRYSGEKFK